MYLYRVVFGNGSEIRVRAESPKAAYEAAKRVYSLEIANVFYVR